MYFSFVRFLVGFFRNGLICFSFGFLVACLPRSNTNFFRFVSDPSSISIYGLFFAMDTESKIAETNLFTNQMVTGGVEWHPRMPIIYVATKTGEVSAIRMRDKKVQWKYKHKNPIRSTPSFIAQNAIFSAKQDYLFVGSQAGDLLALDADTGALLWEYKIGSEIAEKPILAEGRLLVTSANNQLTALDPQTGKWLWQYNRDFPDHMVVWGHAGVLARNHLAYTGFSDGSVVSIEIADGTPKWTRMLTNKTLGFVDTDTTPEWMNNQLFVANYEEGISALQPETGEPIWKKDFSSVTHLAAYDPYVFFTSAEGSAGALDATDGRLVWRFRFPAGNVTKPVYYRGYLSFGVQPGGLIVLDAYSGRLVQRFQSGGGIAELSPNQDFLGFISDGGLVYLMQYGRKQPSTIQIPRPPRPL